MVREGAAELSPIKTCVAGQSEQRCYGCSARQVLFILLTKLAMLSLAQITALLSLLLAFGVDLGTVNHIHDILTPPAASTTPITIVPVQQSPIVPNAPVYFGSTAPVQPVVQQPAPVVQSPVVDSIPFTAPLFTIENVSSAPFSLRVTSTKPIASIELPEGVTLGTPEYDNRQDGSVVYILISGKRTAVPTYYSQIPVNGVVAGQTITVTLKDAAGDVITREKIVGNTN